MVSKLVSRLIKKYRGKMILVSVLISIIISIFFALNNTQLFIKNNMDDVIKNYGGFDFKFTNSRSDESLLKRFSKKYDFTYDNHDVKSKLVEIPTNENTQPIVTDVNNSDKETSKFIFNAIKFGKENKYLKPFIVQGKMPVGINELAVTKEFLNKSNKEIGSKIKIDNQNYKIVAVFGNQSNVASNNGDESISNQGKFDVLFSNNGWDNLSGSVSNIIYAKFNKKISYENRNAIYNKMNKDKLFSYVSNVNDYVKSNKVLKYNEAYLCEKNTFDSYLHNPEIDQENFTYISKLARNSMKRKNCSIDFSSEQQALLNLYQQNEKNAGLTTPNSLGYLYPSTLQLSLTKSQYDVLSKYNYRNYDSNAGRFFKAVSTPLLVDAINKYLLGDLSNDNIKSFTKMVLHNKLVSTNAGNINNDFNLIWANITDPTIFSEYKNILIEFRDAFKTTTTTDAIKTANVVFKKLSGTKKVSKVIFKAFSDYEDDLGAKQLISQYRNQQTLIIYLFIVFGILLVLITSIIISQILKSLNIEIGTLKAIGASKKFIVSKLMRFIYILVAYIAMFTVLFSILIQYLVFSTYINMYSLVNTNLFTIDIISNVIIFTIIFLFIYFFGYLTLRNSIGDNTLLLLKNLNSESKFIKEINIKNNFIRNFWNEIICKNTSKSIIIFFIGMIFSIFTGTLILTFSNVNNYLSGGNASQISTETIYKGPKVDNPLTNSNMVNIQELDVKEVRDFSGKEKTLSNGKSITESDPISFNVLGVESKTIKSENNVFFNVYSFSSKDLDSGLIIPNKYHLIYGINKGDKFVTNYNGKETEFNISGFTKENENIFLYTSNTYIQSKSNNIRSVNAIVGQNEDQPTDKAIKIDALKNIVVQKNQSIVSSIVQILIVLTIILLPIVTIIVSDVVDSNMKTIATMRAIGISKFKIRLKIIQRFSILYILGVLVGLLIVVFGFASKFSIIFFTFLKLDIVYANDWFMLFGVTFVAWILYEITITLSFTRVSIISLSKTLNDDSNRTKISRDDLMKYYKKSFKSILDFQRKPFYYKPTKVKKLQKVVAKSFWNEVFKYVWPLYVSGWISQFQWIPGIITAFIISFIPNNLMATLPPEVTLLVGIIAGNWFLSTWKESITTVAISYATQYYRQQRKVQFRRAIAFSIQITFITQLLLIFLFVLFGQLGLQMSGVPQDTMSYFGLAIVASLVTQLIQSVSVPYSSAIKASGDTKIEIWQQLIQVSTSVLTALFTVVAMFLKDINIVVYVVFVVIINNISGFVPVIYAQFVPKHKQWAGGVWRYVLHFKHPINSRIFNQTIPFIISTVVENLTSYVTTGILTILGLGLISNIADTHSITSTLQNSGFISPLTIPKEISWFLTASPIDQDITSMITAKASYIMMIIWLVNFFRVSTFFDSFNYFMGRILARKNYYFAIQILNDYVKVIIKVYIIQFIIITAVAYGLLEIFGGQSVNSVNITDVTYLISFYGAATIYSIITNIANTYEKTLISGGEFKFTQFVNILKFNVLWISILISMILKLDLITLLSNLIIISIAKVAIYYSRLKTGRWLYCLADDTTIHSNMRGWKDKQLILQNIKDKKYRQQLRK